MAPFSARLTNFSIHNSKCSTATSKCFAFLRCICSSVFKRKFICIHLFMKFFEGKDGWMRETKHFCWIGPVCHFTRKCIINKLTEAFPSKLNFFHFLIFPERRQFVYWNIDFQVKIHFSGSKIRLVTLDASIDLLKGMVLSGEGKSFLADTHFAQLEGIKEESTLLLRNFYKVIFREKNKVFFELRFFYNPYLTIRGQMLDTLWQNFIFGHWSPFWKKKIQLFVYIFMVNVSCLFIYLFTSSVQNTAVCWHFE